MAAVKGGGPVFQVDDDMFDGDGEDDGVTPRDLDADPLLPPEKDEEPDEPEEPKKSKPVKAAEPDEEEDEEPEEAPPFEAPNDPGFLLAQERQARAELEAKHAALEEQVQKLASPPDREAEEDRRLADSRRAVREKAMLATREGDESARQAAMWELQDIDQEIYKRDSARSLREMRAMREGEPTKQKPALTQTQAHELETHTFRSVHRVTPEEEVAMARKWGEFVTKNPAWGTQGVRRWTMLDKALKLVRGNKGRAQVPGGGASLVEGGQNSAPSRTSARSGRPEKSALEYAARAFGMSTSEYEKTVYGGGKKGRK